jgi:single-stranded-DNA-specific exonuclease
MRDSTWILSPPRDETKLLSRELGIPRQLAQVLINRGISSKEEAIEFLYGTLNDIHDPYLMRGMRETLERIRLAISKREKILIFGDYDVDGILSVVVLSKALKSLGALVDYFIPERLKDGYGMKEKHLDLVSQRGVKLIISVDCGIKATQFVKRAKERGIDVIITDHHLPDSQLPEAVAILNPAVSNSGYPFRDLAGIGVVFKLIHALLDQEEKLSSLPHYLKLVSIGTIADVASLKGENRIFVKFGLKGLKEVSNIGLLTLMDACNLNQREVSVGDVGFRIGPRINAAGRMGMADLAVQLFYAENLPESLEIVNQLEKLNSERQKTEEKIYNHALNLIQQKLLDERYKLLILGCEEWHRGVIGIVASKLKDFFHRPVLLFSYEDGKAIGSGRSINEFSMIDCMEECKDLFLSYGGHRMAVGCVLSRENMNNFKKAVNAIAGPRISDEDLKRKIHIDDKLDFQNINSTFLEDFSLLSPFGIGNSKPIFLADNVKVMGNPRLIQGKHIKFLAWQEEKVFEALGWEKGHWVKRLHKGNRIDLAYSIQFSEYLGERKISLSIEDIHQKE